MPIRILPPKRRKKPAPNSAPVQASSGDHLRKILDNTDMAQLVLAHVSAEHLCLCSMVSRSLKSFVDKLGPLQEIFARDLRWWGEAQQKRGRTGNSLQRGGASPPRSDTRRTVLTDPLADEHAPSQRGKSVHAHGARHPRAGWQRRDLRRS